MRKQVAGLWLICLAVSLGGCWSRTEIEDTAYITSVGVDAAGSDYLWTFRIVQAESLPLGMLTNPPPRQEGTATGVMTVRASSLDAAVQMAQASHSRIISLEQLHFVVFGEELAQQGLAPVIEQLASHYQIRRGAGVRVALGAAHEMFMKFKPVDMNPLKTDEGSLLVEKRMHLSPPVRLQHLYSRMLASGVDASIPLEAVNPRAEDAPGSPLASPTGRSLRAGEFPRAGGNPVEVAGTGVFRGDRLVGTLNVNETAWLLALRGELGKQYATFPDPKDPKNVVTIRLGQENKPKFKAAFVNGRPFVHVKLQIDGEIVANPGPTDYSQPENRRLLEASVARERWPKGFAELVDKIYHEWGADPVGFGNLFRSRFPTLDAWQEYGWREHIRDVKVTFEFELIMRRFGLTLGSSVQDLKR